jgi:hypothetical protein
MRTKRVAGTLGTVIMVLFTWTPAQSQDSQNQELQQMKDRMQRLENEMQDLKAQISAAEKMAPIPSATATAPEAGGQGKQEVETPAKKSSVDIYGHVMLDSGYDFKTNDPDWFDVIRPTKLNAFPNEFAPDGKVYFSVRQTRFGVKTSTPTRFGDLKTLFEFELFGTGVDAGQTTFRLRHAYGELGQFGAGQTWSPFMDIDVFPNSLEYWGPNGMVFFRNIQFRWMPIRDEHTELILALERPGASADPGTLAGRIDLSGVKSKFDMPDFSGHIRAKQHWGYVQVAGMLRKITWVDTNPNAAVKIGDTVFGWGVNVSSNVNFSKRDVGRFSFVYGDGIENYMNDAPVDVAPEHTSNPNRPFKGVALPVLGVVSFLDHNWNDHVTSSIGYSLVDIDNSNAQLPSDYHQGHYALTNLLYSPVTSVTVGGEFQYGRRVNFSDGFNANDYRLQFSFKYAWKKGFEF